MKQLRKILFVCLMTWSSLFLTGCDAGKIVEIIQKVVTGIEKALPAIQNVVDTVQNVADEVGGIANTDNQATDQAANNGAGVVIPTAGDQEDIGAATTGTTAGALQQRVSQCATNLIGSTSFRGSEVDGGNLACAQVVSTALKNAGVLDKVVLNCDQVVTDLKQKGWQKVSVPPYQDGDVVTWTTSRGPGRHIGIIVKDGNSFKAMSNSSSQRTPRLTSVTYQPITQVLRKA